MKSKRGFDLVICNEFNVTDKVVTVELYPKWYGLFVVQGDSFEEVPFPMWEDIDQIKLSQSPFRDHVPNPECVIDWCNKHGYKIDELALELMVGRWELETENAYSHLDIPWDV